MRLRILSIVLLTLSCFSTSASASPWKIPTIHPASEGDNSLALPFTMLENSVAYFRIGSFTADIARLIRPTMKQIAAAKPRGLILDFRSNQGGDVQVLQALFESLLPKGTPYMRLITPSVRSLQVTAQSSLLKRSTPVVVLRDDRTVNEPDIAIYVLQKLRKAGVLEFSPHRSALVRIYKQHARMDQYRPIKEGVFFVTPDVRIIGDEGGTEGDVLRRAVTFVRELSPWDEVRK